MNVHPEPAPTPPPDTCPAADPPQRRALKGAKQMTIDATLDYQACDDRICYLSQSVPLSWVIDLRPLDTECAQQP
jgi:hypothetical protein